MQLVGRKTALEEVAKGDVNKINDTATPEENKKFNKQTQERCCRKDNVLFSGYNFKFLYVYL